MNLKQSIPLTLEQTCRLADALIPHARACKKAPSDCKACTVAIEFYGGLPLDTLAVVTADRPILKQSR